MTPPKGPSLDTTLHLLSNERRRQALRLACQRGETTTKELAVPIAAIETGKHPDKVQHQERKRVYIALYQKHLPKLAEAGFITYEEHVITTQPLAHQIWDPIEELDAILNEHDDPRPQSEMGLREKLHAIAGGDPT